MRLPLFLLPACALAFRVPDDLRRELLQGVMGTITAQNHQFLEQNTNSLSAEEPSSRLPDDLIDVNRKDREGNVFDGDMVLTPEQITHFGLNQKEGHRRSKRNIYDGALKWDNNTVFYYIDASINQEKRTAIKNALAELQARTCIDFVQSSTEKYRIKVTHGGGCQTTLGKYWKGEMIMTLGDGCGNTAGNVAHEFMHALGLTHTQSRSDRDNFVTVNDKGGAFEGQNNKMDTINITPYEYGSVMHYPKHAFDGSTPNAIVPRDSRYDYTIGSKIISFYDILMINEYYECGGCARCKNGGVQNVRNCIVCECPAGFGGKLCDQRPEGCGSTLVATETWQEEVITVGSKSDTSIKDIYDKCNTWITAPKGKLIEVKIVELQNPNCNYGCTLNGIEVKGELDARITNPRHCCPESKETLIQSYQNPTPIISYSRTGSSSFTIQYRYSTKCGDNSAYYCVDNYCDNQEDTFAQKKYRCGVSCGLCGKENPVCEDSGECATMLGYYSTCDNMLKNGPFRNDEALLESKCAKSCGYCGNTTTTTAPAPTAKPTVAPSTNSTQSNCQQTSACEIAYGDVLEDAEKFYFCGNHCQTCMDEMFDTCEDSKFCAKLIKESGGSCETLWEFLNQDRALYNFYCFKSCSFLC